MNAPGAQPLDALPVGQRLQERDQSLPGVEERHLVGRRGRHLRDDLGLPRIADRRTGSA